MLGELLALEAAPHAAAMTSSTAAARRKTRERESHYGGEKEPQGGATAATPTMAYRAVSAVSARRAPAGSDFNRLP